MKNGKRWAGGTSYGFTIIELTVVLAILIMLCVLLSRFTGHTQAIVGANIKQLDAESQAQVAFDRIALDLSHLEEGKHQPFDLNPPGSNIPLQFLSSVPSRSATSDDRRGVSVVAYRIANEALAGSSTGATSTSICLQRASKGVRWSDTIMGQDDTGKTLSFRDLSASLLPSDPDFEVLAKGVIRMEMGCRLKKTGEIIDRLESYYAGTGKTLTVADVDAIVVSIVVLDERSITTLTPQNVQTIASKFPPPEMNTQGIWAQPPSENWSAIAKAPENFPDIPPPAVRSLTVFQRFFSIR